MGADFYFTEGVTSNPAAFITIMVWEDAGGSPGAVVYTENLLIDEIEANVTGPGAGSFYITRVDFDLPVNVSTADFYVGYELLYAAGDTVNCALTDDLTSDPSRSNTMMYYINPSDDPLVTGGGWFQTGGDIGAAEWSMHIYPRITQTPPTAVISPNFPSCQGTYVNFDGSTSPNTVNWEWAINGTATPYPSGSNPSVLMNASGTHTVYLVAYNGCGFYHVDSSIVSIIPIPSVDVTSSNDTVCPGGSSNLSATGALSFVWSPAAGLSCTSCTNPVATPSSTTTYSVTGTTAACSATTYVTIEVDDSAPTADFINSADTICPGESVNYNGAISVGASIYSWTFTGGDISTSSSANPTVVYNTGGSYTADLWIQNTCGQADSMSVTIVVKDPVDCATGSEIPAGQSLLGVSAFMNRHQGEIMVSFGNSFDGEVTLELFSVIGELVSKNTIYSPAQGAVYAVSASGLAHSIYVLHISSEGSSFAKKLFVE